MNIPLNTSFSPSRDQTFSLIGMDHCTVDWPLSTPTPPADPPLCRHCIISRTNYCTQMPQNDIPRLQVATAAAVVTQSQQVNPAKAIQSFSKQSKVWDETPCSLRSALWKMLSWRNPSDECSVALYLYELGKVMEVDVD